MSVRSSAPVRRCWPLCIIPLMMSRDKNVRTLCPRCGHDYDADRPTDNKQRCSPKCAPSRGKFSDLATTRPRRRLRSECDGSRAQTEYRERKVSGTLHRCANYNVRSNSTCVPLLPVHSRTLPLRSKIPSVISGPRLSSRVGAHYEICFAILESVTRVIRD